MRLDALPKPTNGSLRILTGSQMPILRPAAPRSRFHSYIVSSAATDSTSFNVNPLVVALRSASAPWGSENVVQCLVADGFPGRVQRGAQRSHTGFRLALGGGWARAGGTT